jgi:hypothetical protein
VCRGRVSLTRKCRQSTPSSLTLSSSHSVLFGDVNGDCAADLLLPTNDLTSSSSCAGVRVCVCAVISHVSRCITLTHSSWCVL